MAISFSVTILFRADVDAQGGAYATGVLVLITSAALAVTLSVSKTALRWPYIFVSFVFVYTTVANIYERPEGLKIASFFIVAIVVTSLVSRALRSTELRIHGVELDETAKCLLAEDEDQVILMRPCSPSNTRQAEAVACGGSGPLFGRAGKTRQGTPPRFPLPNKVLALSALNAEASHVHI
jgi:hypothetical protein